MSTRVHLKKMAVGSGFAVLAVAVATLVRWLLDPILGDAVPFITYFVAIVVVARYAGWEPSLVTLVLGGFVAAWLFFPMGQSPMGLTPRAALWLLLYLGLGGLIAWLMESVRNSGQIASEQREWLRTALTSIGDAVITTDAEGRVTFLNPLAENLTGWSAEQAKGQALEQVFRLVNESSREPVESPVDKVLREGTIVGLANHMILISRDGAACPIDDSAAPIRGAEGTLRGVVLVFRDIRDRRRFERRQAAQHAASRILADSSTLDEATEKLLGAVGEALGWDLGLFWLVDESAGVLRCASAWNAPPVSAPSFVATSRELTFAPGQGLPGQIWSSRQPIWVADMLQEGYFPRAPIADQEGLHGALAFPIMLHGEVLGVVEFFSFAIEAPDPDLMRTMESIGSQLGQFIERKRSEAATRANEERLRLALQAGQMGTWEWEIGADRVIWSPGLEAIHGLAPGTFPGTFEAYQEDIHPEDRARVLETIARSVEQGTDHHLEYRLVLPDGCTRWVEARGTLFRDETGAPVRMVGICMDITKRMEAQKALQASEGRFRQLADAMPQIVWAARADGTLDYYNQQRYEHVGESQSETGDESWTPVIHPDDRARSLEAWYEAVRAGVPYQIEHRFWHKTAGQYRWHLSRALPVRDESGQIIRWYGTSTDIDYQKRIEQELRAAKDQAEAASQAREQFLAMLSHELRTPLTPVLLAASALQDDKDTPEHLRPFLEMIRQNVELETRLIDDLLDVMRIIQGKLSYQCEVMNAHEPIHRALDVCRNELERKFITPVVDLKASATHVQGDPARLQQVLWNLLKNAAKFTPERGRIAVRSWNENAELVIEVSDNGIGIDPETLPKIFRAFEQAEDANTQQFGGLGLGLAISRSIVELHGGTLNANSAGRGRGATFTLRLRTIPAPASDGQPPPPSESPASKDRGLRLLLVEDDAMTSRIMAKLLRQVGYHVTTANSLAEALQQPLDDCDLIISDIGLPDGSGLDLMRQVRAHLDIPGIALTGFGMDDDIRQTREAGFVAHLTKPIDFTKLDAMIQRVAEDRTATV